MAGAGQRLPDHRAPTSSRSRSAPRRVRRSATPTSGWAPTAILLLSDRPSPRTSADLRIFNPDGSRGRAVRQRRPARRSCTCATRGWTDADSFSIGTPRGRIRPTITGPTRARWTWGSRAWPPLTSRPGPPDGRGQLERQTATSGASATSRSATRNARSGSAPRRSCRRSTSAASDRRSATTPASRTAPTCPGTWSWQVRQVRPGGSHSGPDLRARGGGDAVLRDRGQRRRRRLRRGSAAAAGTATVVVSLDGGELRVEVGEDLQVTLTGWARPVFAGHLSEDLERELHETE